MWVWVETGMSSFPPLYATVRSVGQHACMYAVDGWVGGMDASITRRDSMEERDEDPTHPPTHPPTHSQPHTGLPASLSSCSLTDAEDLEAFSSSSSTSTSDHLQNLWTRVTDSPTPQEQEKGAQGLATLLKVRPPTHPPTHLHVYPPIHPPIHPPT